MSTRYILKKKKKIYVTIKRVREVGFTRIMFLLKVYNVFGKCG